LVAARPERAAEDEPSRRETNGSLAREENGNVVATLLVYPPVPVFASKHL
jgi:hypothetical protein